MKRILNNETDIKQMGQVQIGAQTPPTTKTLS